MYVSVITLTLLYVTENDVLVLPPVLAVNFCSVSHAGPMQDIASSLSNVRELDISMNAISQWQEVSIINWSHRVSVKHIEDQILRSFTWRVVITNLKQRLALYQALATFCDLMILCGTLCVPKDPSSVVAFFWRPFPFFVVCWQSSYYNSNCADMKD
jgi:hypothetical protein